MARLAALFFAVFTAPAFAAPTIALQSGAAESFSIPAGSATNSFYIDVDSSATQLNFQLDAQQPTTADIDLLLRYGSAFPDDAGTGVAPDATFLFDLAQYRSASVTGNEFITINQSNVFPVKAGRWYIEILNFANSSVTASVRATASSIATPNAPIEVVFDDSSGGCEIGQWADATAKAPAGGNPGTTLGAQRKNAVLETARLLGTQLKSPVPVRVQACWKDLGTGNAITLAQAGPRDFLINQKFLSRNQTFFSAAGATKLGGTSLCRLRGGDCNVYEIRATFNFQVDTPNALGANSFYYGYVPPGVGTTNDVDFVSVAMHEITHGLGFIGLVNIDAGAGPVGEKPDGYDDIYDANIVHVRPDNSFVRFAEETNAERATALTSDMGLRWDEPQAVNSSLNPFAADPAPNSYIKLHTPSEIVKGSTLSHISTFYGRQMMAATYAGPLRDIGFAQPMLTAMGFNDAPSEAKTFALAPSELYFDPAHPGHGIGFTRIADNVYFLALYTYDDSDAPEWYIAIGPLVDGVFTPAQNANGDSLVRYKYVNGAATPQQPDPSIHGVIRLDFNQAGLAPSCNNGTAHDKSGTLGVMTFNIAAGQLDPQRELAWCMQPLIPSSLATTPDFTGTWYGGGSDSGWGFSLASFQGAPKALFGVLYYPDSNGNGRWAYLISSSFSNGTTYNLVERHGYCRACAVPESVLAGQFDDRNAGTISLNLNQAVQNQSAGPGTFSVNYQLPPGGPFLRTNFPMTLLSVAPGT